MKSLYILLILVVFSSCFGKKERKIGLLMDDFVQERWEKDRNYFVQKVKELGGKVLVEAAQGDPKLQLEQAKGLIEQGVSVLVIVPVDNQLANEVVNYAHQKKIEVICYDRLITNGMADYYVSTNNTKIGEMQASYLVKRKPKGKYALIEGPTTDNNTSQLLLGHFNILQPLIENRDISIVFRTHVNRWAAEEGTRAMDSILKMGLKVDAVIAANDDLAKGAIKSLEEKQYPAEVLVAGQDADISALKYINQRKQAVTIYKPIQLMAYAAAELALRVANNDKSPMNYTSLNNGKKMISTILLDPITIYKENIKATVIKDGYISEKEIYEGN